MKAFLIGLHFFDDPTSFVLDLGYDPTQSQERFGTLERASDRCLELNCFSPHVGEHICHFTAEALSDGGFGVVCATHPVAVEVF